MATSTKPGGEPATNIGPLENVGERVHYVEEGGAHRPAFIIDQMPEGTGGENVAENVLKLPQQDPNNTGDLGIQDPGNEPPQVPLNPMQRLLVLGWSTVYWAIAQEDEDEAPGTWHWPEV